MSITIRKNERGSALVEYALVLPYLLILLWGMHAMAHKILFALRSVVGWSS